MDLQSQLENLFPDHKYSEVESEVSKEKPEFSYLVSSGMYLIRKSAIDRIPHDEFYNITDLISSVRSSGGQVGVYPISEKSWLDTGEWKEYKKTIDQLTFWIYLRKF